MCMGIVTGNQTFHPVHHNISCEMTNYTPIHLDVLKRRIEEKRSRK